MARDRGSATVEFAVILPAIIGLLAFILGAAAWGVTAVRAQGAASVAARVALTEGDAAARSVGAEAAGAGAQVWVQRDSGWIRVTVVAVGPWGVPIRASAVAKEQG